MRRIILVRHGQSRMNLSQTGVVGGQSNESPLTPLGEKQAAALGRHLHRHLHPHPAPALLVASTAVRARDTARLAVAAAAPALAGVEVETTPALLELGQGEWEGAARSECYTAATLAAIDADPFNFAAPGGESQRQVEERVTAHIVGHVLPRLDPGGPPGVVVAHGLAIKCFLRGLLGSNPGLTWKIRLDNTAVVEVGWVEGGNAGGWHLLRVNDTAHLLAEGVEC